MHIVQSLEMPVFAPEPVPPRGLVFHAHPHPMSTPACVHCPPSCTFSRHLHAQQIGVASLLSAGPGRASTHATGLAAPGTLKGKLSPVSGWVPMLRPEVLMAAPEREAEPESLFLNKTTEESPGESEFVVRPPPQA